MTYDFPKITRLAKKATPGPWTMMQSDDPDFQYGVMAQPHPAMRGFTKPICGCCPKDDEANAAYIAAANPSAWLAMAKRVEELEKALKPFALAASGYNLAYQDNDLVYTTVGNLRKAEAAIKGGK